MSTVTFFGNVGFQSDLVIFSYKVDAFLSLLLVVVLRNGEGFHNDWVVLLSNSSLEKKREKKNIFIRRDL